MLIDRGVKFTESNNKGWNVLHFALKNNDLQSLSYLLEGELRYYSDLHLFAYQERPQAFRQWILDIQVLMSKQTDRYFNLLHICAMHCSEEITEYIIKNYILRNAMFED